MSSELSVKMAGWLGHVRAASEQGLTIAAYANAQGLSAAALYQAKSVLMKCGTWPRTTQRSSSNKLRAKASAFVPVRIVADDAAVVGGGLEVALSNGRAIRVPPGFDAATLRQLLTVLEEGQPC